jgi:hypothetical protein
MFAEQARLEAAELTRDPDKCREHIEMASGFTWWFCSRNAAYEDGFCAQHHNGRQAEAAARARSPYKHADE